MRTVTIPLINDNIQESREWLLVELVLPADQVGTLLGAPVVSNVTILDDDCKYRLACINAQYTNIGILFFHSC